MDNSTYIKASLDRLLEENDNVFVVPHIRPDFDAVGSTLGIALICKKNNKNCFIVIDDDYDTSEKTLRILSIDAEKRNKQICDYIIDNSSNDGAAILRDLIYGR